MLELFTGEQQSGVETVGSFLCQHSEVPQSVQRTKPEPVINSHIKQHIG